MRDIHSSEITRACRLLAILLYRYRTVTMDDIVSSPPLPNLRKRSAPDETSLEKKPLNLKGTQFMMPTPPDTEESSNASPTATAGHEEGGAASPAPSSSALSSVQETLSEVLGTSNTVNATSSAPARATPSGQPPQKRRKLTPGEKLEQQRMKEAKAAEKAEQKARREEEKVRKEEEKRVKDEEKRVKDEEKRRKAEEKEAKKREKEIEEERKSQDKLKKERSQMRLGAFFQKPATPSKSPMPNDDTEDAAIRARRRSLSLETFDSVADQIRAASPTKGTPQPAEKKTPLRPAVSDYRRYFLPFEAQTHTTIAALRHADRPSEDVDLAQARFDTQIQDPSLQEKYDLGLADSYASVESLFAAQRELQRGLQFPSARQVVEQINGYSSTQPIDLTDESPPDNPMTLLQTLPQRYLHFAEDVRPPYYGTYSKQRSPRFSRRLSRNPFARERKDTEYDYDSEAEWEEPEEGEDILDNEDDDAESTGDADEMDGFLDDEHDELKNKRKLITGDLVPVSTGLCWENDKGRIQPSVERDDGASDMKGMRLGFLLPSFTGKSIDPFSTSYWEPEIMPPPGVPVKEVFGSATQLARQPLKERSNSSQNATVELVGAAEGQKGPINSVTATQSGEKRGRKPSPKTLSKEDLDEFKDAVVGSQLGKLELCKGLKAR